MGEWVWAAGCLAAGVLTVARHVYMEEAASYIEGTRNGEDNPRAYVARGLAGMSLVALSLAVSWSSTVYPLFAVLRRVLPGAGSPSQVGAAVILTGIAAIAFVTGVVYITVRAVEAATTWLQRHRWRAGTKAARSVKTRQQALDAFNVP